MEDFTLFYLILITVLIIISGLFSCAETSVTASSRAKIHRLKNEGNKRAKKLEKLLKEREKVVGSMLVGNNAVSILSSALATSVMIKYFGEIGLIYATFIMTIIVLIFSDIAPKTFALRSPDNIGLFLSSFITVSVKILFPCTFVIQKISNFFADLFFAKPNKASKEAQLEEIRDTVDLKAKEGAIFKYDKDLLEGVLDLSDTEISEIMVHRKDIESLNIELPIDELVEQALKINYTRIPLWRGNKENIVAILNVRKLLKNLHFHRGNISKLDPKTRSKSKPDQSSVFFSSSDLFSQSMAKNCEQVLALATSEPWFAPASNSLRSQLVAFRKKKKRFALVIDEYGSLLGLITLEDILEEIVGDIKEQEELALDIIKIKSGAYKITGKTLVRDINKKLDWDIVESDDAYNLNAFVIEKLGRIPDEKENFIIENYQFEVLKKKNNNLFLLRVKRF